MHSIEGRADDGRQVVACGVSRSVEAGDIVVAVADQVGAVLGRDAGRHRRAPWVGADSPESISSDSSPKLHPP